MDGKGYDVKLQHPLDVASVPDEPAVIFVADSYNHKVGTQQFVTKASINFQVIVCEIIR